MAIQIERGGAHAPSSMQRGRAPYPVAAETLIKGKRYLDVAARVAWVRRDYPAAHIETAVYSLSGTGAVITARVVLWSDAGANEGVGTGIGSCRAEDFGDFIEKAETRAIGRALGALGYGTGADLDDGGHVADSPRAIRRAVPR